jgi:predicted metal-dependent enzyme (double-stranded beta helix superfamily)
MNAISAPIGVGKTDVLDSLISDLRVIINRTARADITAHLVGERLAFSLGLPNLLTAAQRESDPAGYRQHVLHVEPDGGFSVVALVWLPGQRTTIHDHVSWCATGVHEGEETERRYRIVRDSRGLHLEQTDLVVNQVADVCGFAPPGDIHEVINSSPATTTSIHVYGTDIRRLGSSIRRVYDLPIDSAAGPHTGRV